MAEMTGTVTCLAVSEHAAFTTIKNASGTVEAFSLWFSGSGGEPTPSELRRAWRTVCGCRCWPRHTRMA